jgi:hypothetical protein
MAARTLVRPAGDFNTLPPARPPDAAASAYHARATMSDWLCIIRPPRATFISDMRDDDRAGMREHLAYLERLLGEGGLLLAGRD